MNLELLIELLARLAADRAIRQVDTQAAAAHHPPREEERDARHRLRQIQHRAAVGHVD